MASIQKKPSGSYQYTISRMINGKSQPIRKAGFRTKKEAQIAALEVESKLAKGLLPSLVKIPFDEYFDNWIELYKQDKVSSTTLEHYQYSLRAIKKHFFNVPVQDIKRNDYQKFLNCLGNNKAKETVAKINGHIKSCVKDALEDHIIQTDFTRKTKLHWTNSAKSSMEKHLNYDESVLLLKSILTKVNDGLGYSLLLLGLTSGMRFGELVGLTKKDFDFNNSTIDINKTWGYKKLSEAGFGPTKNDQSKRIIKMDTKTMQYFNDLFKNSKVNSQQLVFYSPESKYKVISNTNANKLLKKLLNELKIDPITIHGLRHTHASVLLYKKASIHYVSERLGHSDIETTLKEYTHVLKEVRLQDEQLTVLTFENMIS